MSPHTNLTPGTVPDPARHARTHGGVLPLAAFRAAGFSDRDIAAARRSGSLQPVRRGWLAAPDAPPDVVRAARVGGSLTAGSVARLHGLWLVEDTTLHVRVASTASRLRSPTDAGMRLDPEKHGVCVHYRPAASASRRPQHPGSSPGGGTPTDLPARDGLPRAIAELFRCTGTLAGMVALESALNLGQLDTAGRAAVRSLVPARDRPFVDDAHADADSGLETLARLLFRRHRIRYRTQAAFAGVGRVDLLVGDRLVIELDGEEFHSGLEFEQDRRRDFELTLRGYLVVRLSWRMVTHDWDRVERGLLELVARRAHRWAGGAQREHPPFL